MRELLTGVVGSTAYGLATAGSDIDRLGVYAADPREVLGLHGPEIVAGSHVTTHPDVTMHELGKFARLALTCNPTVSELLWLPRYETATDAGLQLVAAREAFLSTRHVRGAFGGYAVQQARKLAHRHENGGTPAPAARIAKHGRHCLRLLRQAATLLREGRLVIDQSAIRDELFAAGELAASDPAAFAALFEAEMATLESIDSVLPDAPDTARVDGLVARIRLGQLGF